MRSRPRELCPPGATPDDPATSQAAGRRGARSRSERGASLVEYTLLIAALVIPTIAGITFIRNGAESQVNRTATEISSKTIPSVPEASGG